LKSIYYNKLKLFF